MRDYYEEILNGLVYELYLPEELYGAGRRFFDLVEAADLPEIAASGKAQPAEQLARLRDKFEELYAPAHPLRAALEKLHTLESVRITGVPPPLPARMRLNPIPAPQPEGSGSRGPMAGQHGRRADGPECR